MFRNILFYFFFQEKAIFVVYQRANKSSLNCEKRVVREQANVVLVSEVGFVNGFSIFVKFWVLGLLMSWKKKIRN